jgi:erythromycin esterase-like protein
MTEAGEAGELNVGHLMRQANDGDSILVGFTTYTGEVIAASEWGEPGEKMKVRRRFPKLRKTLSRYGRAELSFNFSRQRTAHRTIGASEAGASHRRDL